MHLLPILLLCHPVRTMPPQVAEARPPLQICGAHCIMTLCEHYEIPARFTSVNDSLGGGLYSPVSLAAVAEALTKRGLNPKYVGRDSSFTADDTFVAHMDGNHFVVGQAFPGQAHPGNEKRVYRLVWSPGRVVQMSEADFFSRSSPVLLLVQGNETEGACTPADRTLLLILTAVASLLAVAIAMPSPLHTLLHQGSKV